MEGPPRIFMGIQRRFMLHRQRETRRLICEAVRGITREVSLVKSFAVLFRFRIL